MTKQKTFNTVLRHAREQGKKALNFGNPLCKCAYRNRDGLKCFVGCLIPDKRYRARFEGNNAGCGEIAELLQELGHDVKLCVQLQQVHDSLYNMRSPIVTQWERQFVKIASSHELTYYPPQEVSNVKTGNI